MQVRLLAFLIWAGVAASAAFWLLRLGSSSPTAPAHTVAVATTTAPRGDLTRVFGAPPSAAPAGPAAAPLEPALASRFKLLGVAAPRDGEDRIGLALISVDGKPARGVKVGAVVDGELVLQSVHARGASIGAPGAAPSVTLELPAVPLAGGGGRSGGPVTMPPPVPVLPNPVPTAVVPPPPPMVPPPGMRAPEMGEPNEPQVAPAGMQNNTR